MGGINPFQYHLPNLNIFPPYPSPFLSCYYVLKITGVKSQNYLGHDVANSDKLFQEIHLIYAGSQKKSLVKYSAKIP